MAVCGGGSGEEGRVQGCQLSGEMRSIEKKRSRAKTKKKRGAVLGPLYRKCRGGKNERKLQQSKSSSVDNVRRSGQGKEGGVFLNWGSFADQRMTIPPKEGKHERKEEEKKGKKSQ